MSRVSSSTFITSSFVPHNFIFKPIDIIVLAWAISGMIVYTLLHGTFSALIFKLGVVFDICGMYFFFRLLIRNWQDVETIIRGLVIISVPVTVVFMIEFLTGRNMFSIFGGIPAVTLVRDGKLRCQGAFAHPIMAGCFWASLMPLFAARWWARGKGRIEAVVGVTASVLLVLMCASTTPLISLAIGIFATCMFALRHYMRIIRWSAAIFIVGLHLFMNAPVWHLVSRVNIFGSSTGWHRYNLINQAISHLGEWWLLGPTSPVHWDDYRRLTDITNQYILEGIRGGLITLVFFIVLLALAFQGVGRLWRLAESNNDKERPVNFLAIDTTCLRLASTNLR